MEVSLSSLFRAESIECIHYTLCCVIYLGAMFVLKFFFSIKNVINNSNNNNLM